MSHDCPKLLSVMAGVGVAALAAAISVAADIVPTGPTAAEADASIVCACTVDVPVSLDTRVESFADSAPGRINSNEARGFSLLFR